MLATSSNPTQKPPRLLPRSKAKTPFGVSSLLPTLDTLGTVDWKAIEREMQWLTVSMPQLGIAGTRV